MIGGHVRPGALPLAIFLVCTLQAAGAEAASHALARIETSLAGKRCAPASGPAAAHYAVRDLGAVRCPAPRGFRLWLVSSDANSWLDLERGNQRWSAEEFVVYRANAGMFPNVTGTVVWLRRRNGEWAGLIFRIAARDEDNRHHLSHVAVRTASGTICVIGDFPTQQAATAALASDAVCK